MGAPSPPEGSCEDFAAGAGDSCPSDPRSAQSARPGPRGAFAVPRHTAGHEECTDERERRPADRRPGPAADLARIYVGAGRSQGIRPKDLVGALANESGLTDRDGGNIEITPNFSLVEVRSGAADEVICTLRNTTIKGRRATVRPDRNAKG